MTIAAQPHDSAYGAFAAYYDRFTADHDYDLWVSVVEALARSHGFRDRGLIDAACGTGKSFLPWARRGFRVTALDRSAQMLAIARSKCDAERLPVRLFVHDLRTPWRGDTASLVTCLDDALNYQVTDGDLGALLCGIATLIRPGGLAVFDTNTRRTYASSYVRSSTVRDSGVTMRWRGRHLAGDLFEAVIDVCDEDDTELRSVHRQRYWPQDRVEAAIAAADLRLQAVHGMSRDGSTAPSADDGRHTKVLYVVTR